MIQGLKRVNTIHWTYVNKHYKTYDSLFCNPMCSSEFKSVCALLQLPVVSVTKSVLVSVLIFSSWHVPHLPQHTAWIHVVNIVWNPPMHGAFVESWHSCADRKGNPQSPLFLHAQWRTLKHKQAYEQLVVDSKGKSAVQFTGHNIS